MGKLKLILEYDGTSFQGWQRQSHPHTLQEAVEAAIANLSGKRVDVVAASRTDAGVHAEGQVAHFTPEGRDFAPWEWHKGLNSFLPSTIRVRSVEAVAESFHAIRSATRKLYRYRILNRGHASALEPRVYFFPRRLDWDRMRRAAQAFVGTHDFASYRAANSSAKTTERTIYRCDITEEGQGFYSIEVEGSGFLKQMVRTMVGTLLEIGEGKRPAEDISATLLAKDRRKAGHTAPAAGLCLVWVEYDTLKG